MAMFPLGTVLFPTAVLPLHVFEPRYREMTQHCLESDREFGVVMIERGSEVGGGDQRSEVGTVAHIHSAEEFDDGRWALVTVGTRRIRVVEWQLDDPYPKAVVEDWPDPPAVAGDADRFGEVVVLLRRVLAWNAEMGRAAPASTVELSEDPAVGSYQAAAVAPLGPMDRQRLLATESVAERLEALGTLLDDELSFMAAQFNALQSDDPTDPSGETHRE
jgi:Lon protease-like protein